jgi:hypothetical protein
MNKQRNFDIISKVVETWEKPVPTPSVLIKEVYDEKSMLKTRTTYNVGHIFKDKLEGKRTTKEYSHTNITVEEYKIPLRVKDIQNKRKADRITLVGDEVSRLNLDEFKDKASIMKFACDNGKSNGEKRLRATVLQKALQKKQEEEYHMFRTAKNLVLQNSGTGKTYLILKSKVEAYGKHKKRYQRMNDMVFYPRHRITTQEISAY